MNEFWLILGSVLVLALVIFITFKMAERQQTALAVEKRTIPPKLTIFALGLITTLSYTVAIVGVILVLIVPFSNFTFGGTLGNTTTILFVIIFAGIAVGTGSYWLFVRLGFFSWKVFSLD